MPAGEQRRAGLGQVLVPHVEGAQGRSALAAGRRGRLQQGVALLEHPVVVAAHRGVARVARHQQLVEKPPPVARIALDQGEVFRREQYGPQGAEDLARARHRRAAELGPVGPARTDLDLDRRVPAVPDDDRAHDRAVGSGSDQRRGQRDPVAAEGRDVAQRLDQVGLALPVRADQRGDARLQVEARAVVRAEVRDGQVPDVHRARVASERSRTGRARRQVRRRRPRRHPSPPCRPQP